MTDTQFQVGKVYATRSGDRVRVTADDPEYGYYRLRGVLITTNEKDMSWAHDGRYFCGVEHPLDLLPGALSTPTPIPIPEAGDDKAELLAALREAADAFHSIQEYWNGSRTDGEMSDALDVILERADRGEEEARRAIANAERT